MDYNKFLIRVLIISVIMAISGAITLWSFTVDHLKVARFTFLAFWLLSIFFMIRFVNKNNQRLESFLDMLRGNDRLAELNHKGSSFSGLNMAFNRIMDSISNLRIEKEEQFHLFRTAFEQVDVGLLAFNSNGNVLIINAGAKKLLGVTYLNNISELSGIHPGFMDILLEKKQEKSRMLSILTGGKLRKLAIRTVSFKLRGELTQMVSFQDIQTELEVGELDAWQKLIRVITHEIMNSITPMKTLSLTLLNALESNGKPCKITDLDDQKIKNTHLGLSVIQKRSKGLAQFVNSYRSITRIPTPDIRTIEVSSIFQEVEQLIGGEVEKRNIKIHRVGIEEKLEFLADLKLIVQVMINLIVNALHSIESIKAPLIEMGAYRGAEGDVVLYVQDNGIGIDDAIRENIFVPFFTTKKDGSGIGLSFSQQVMRLHKGDIVVFSEPGRGARFELQF